MSLTSLEPIKGLSAFGPFSSQGFKSAKAFGHEPQTSNSKHPPMQAIGSLTGAHWGMLEEFRVWEFGGLALGGLRFKV